MDIQLYWHKPLNLYDGSDSNLIYDINLDAVPTSAGIYLFAREYGQSVSILYVGKGTNLRSRLKSQLNNVRLMRAIQNAPKGYRILTFAELATRSQQLDKALRIVESSFIRHYVVEGHELLNVQGTIIKIHTINSERNHLKKFVPKVIYTEQ